MYSTLNFANSTLTKEGEEGINVYASMNLIAQKGAAKYTV